MAGDCASLGSVAEVASEKPGAFVHLCRTTGVMKPAGGKHEAEAG